MRYSVLLPIAILASLIIAQAQTPLLPLVVKGGIKIGSAEAPVGTYVIAKLGDDELAKTMVDEEGFYALTIPGNDSLESKEISVYVNTIDTGETVVWEEGGIIDLDLSVEGAPDEDDWPDYEEVEGAPDEDEPLPDEPIGGEPLPDEPLGETPEPEGSDAGAAEETTSAPSEPQDLGHNPSKTPSGDVGDNSTLFILIIVIIAAIFLSTIMLKTFRGNKK